MQALQADPQNIRTIFGKEYIIPDFQRRYSWEKEQCDKLWTDILENFQRTLDNPNNPIEQYFIGSIVLFKHEQAGETIYQVIDGQQRLTTLSLLIKTLHNSNSSMGALERCLKKINRTTDKMENNIRLESHVIDEDKSALRKIILGNYQELDVNNIFCKNYEFLNEKVNETLAEFRNQEDSSERITRFVEFILDKLVMLPIICGSEDDAITIFERLNDTGLALSDTDIFKSKLYKSLDDKEDFIATWNDLGEHDWLFRVHMHYCRAKRGMVGSEVGLRNFFNSKDFEQINKGNAKSILEGLVLYKAIMDFVPENKICIKTTILARYPNFYWKFPYFLWLAKNGQLNDEGKFELPTDTSLKEEFETLMETLIKFFVVRGAVHRTVNSEKTYIFALCRDIVNDDDNYLDNIRVKIEEDKGSLLANIDKTEYLGRYLDVVLHVSSYLNANSEPEFLQFLQSNPEIEHILPRKWANCNYWTEESANANLNRIGNLILLEKKLNIQASNDFFERKKRRFEKSNSSEVRKLCEYENWDNQALEQRHQAVISSFKKWLEIS